MSLVKGVNLSPSEQKLKAFLVRSKPIQNDPVSKHAYNQAYDIVMDLGEVLESDNDFVKYDGVRVMFKRISEFRESEQIQHAVVIKPDVSGCDKTVTTLKVVK
ncbi:hypothetical protein [Pseudoalteromonas sp. T1lg23B]|uniref:hypothetical protein n=1 Tax=Pseudoalteromonas sp. T1lg23B TaxID=2077097 RepID=UPI00131A2876|nr:hypothetical protein [Pseudoalteromonas sp. T1lg23B]